MRLKRRCAGLLAQSQEFNEKDEESKKKKQELAKEAEGCWQAAMKPLEKVRNKEGEELREKSEELEMQKQDLLVKRGWFLKEVRALGKKSEELGDVHCRLQEEMRKSQEDEGKFTSMLSTADERKERLQKKYVTLQETLWAKEAEQKKGAK